MELDSESRRAQRAECPPEPRVGASLWRLLLSIVVLWLGCAGALHAAGDGECGELTRSELRRGPALEQGEDGALAAAVLRLAGGAERPDSDPHKHTLSSGVSDSDSPAKNLEVEVEVEAAALASEVSAGAGRSATIRARRVRLLLRSESQARRRSRAPPAVE